MQWTKNGRTWHEIDVATLPSNIRILYDACKREYAKLADVKEVVDRSRIVLNDAINTYTRQQVDVSFVLGKLFVSPAAAKKKAPGPRHEAMNLSDITRGLK